MEQNGGKNPKRELKILIISAVVLILLGAGVAIAGVFFYNDGMIAIGITCVVLFALLYTWEIISAVMKLKKAKVETAAESEIETKLIEDYKALKEEDYSEVGTVKFVNEGLKFEAEGKFACVENFNNIAGKHLAFNIQGTKLKSMPEGYDDVVGYEDCLFDLNLGYFDDIALSLPENESGIVVQEVTNLEGQTIEIDASSGYVSTIYTAESDTVLFGEIKFVKWNTRTKIISFKFIVESGLCDIVAGTVKLTKDKVEKE